VTTRTEIFRRPHYVETRHGSMGSSAWSTRFSDRNGGGRETSIEGERAVWSRGDAAAQHAQTRLVITERFSRFRIGLCVTIWSFIAGEHLGPGLILIKGHTESI
jgi:hypothetical protein